MSSKIEQLIDEIEQYIDGCKYKALSNTQIIVNKEEIDELLRELRMRTPEEIKLYQKVISHRESILQEARNKAELLLKETTDKTQRLVNEHEIMQQAYTQANEVVKLASAQAQDILDNATMEANNVRAAAMEYMDNMLAEVETIMNQTMNITQSHYESFMTQINQYADVISTNRVQLNPPGVGEYIPTEELLNEPATVSEEAESTTGTINLDMI